MARPDGNRQTQAAGEIFRELRTGKTDYSQTELFKTFGEKYHLDHSTVNKLEKGRMPRGPENLDEYVQAYAEASGMTENGVWDLIRDRIKQNRTAEQAENHTAQALEKQRRPRRKRAP